MLHTLAFVVIGLGAGVALRLGARGSRAVPVLVLAMALGLAGSLLGGEVVLHALGYLHGKYVSVLAAIVLAVVLASLTRLRRA